MPSQHAQPILSDPTFKSVLPSSFLYACSSASYQIEGGHDADGKGVGVWDAFFKGKEETGEVACNSYNLWKEDVKLLKEYGCNTYRFSISWPRIIPNGSKGDPVNEKGIKYYSDLVDALLDEGITPCVTIFHWDYPQALEDKYGGFISEEVIDDFVAYSKILFERLGDRVKHWITINEPHIFTFLQSLAWKADKWDYERDMPKLAKTLLLCNAKTVDLYRREFQSTQKGTIGITLNADWVEPIDESKEAKEMAQLTLDYILGMYADPIYLGHFPESVATELGDKMPTFTEEEWSLIKGSSDFFGWNHYGTKWATGKRIPKEDVDNARFWSFGRTEQVAEKGGVQIGVKGENGHPYIVPWGFRKLINYINGRYAKPCNIPIWITENGFPVEDESKLPLAEQRDDDLRQKYFGQYLKELVEAVRDDNVNIGGYMAWSLLDNLEWIMGYKPRFGLTVVDREDGCNRYPKQSAYLLRDIFAHVKARCFRMARVFELGRAYACHTDATVEALPHLNV